MSLRILSLIVLVAVAAWLFWSPRSTGPGHDDAGAASRRYVIRFDPGEYYQPGQAALGVGPPLEGYYQVIADFEKTHPDTHIDPVRIPRGRDFLVTQLNSARAPEIVSVEVQDVWSDVSKGWYIPLDPYLAAPNPYVAPGAPGSRQWWDLFKYQALTRGRAAPNGQMYCIAFDAQETAIYYNTAIFAKLGISPPASFAQMLADMQRIKDAGYVPLAADLGIFVDWSFDIVFDDLYSALLPGIDLHKDPLRESAGTGYLDWYEICYLHRHHFFTPADPRYREAWRLIKAFRDASGQSTANDGFGAFASGEAAMNWQPCYVSYRLAADPAVHIPWSLFYFPPVTRESSPFATGSDSSVISGVGTQYEVTNSAISDTGDAATSTKLKRTIEFLQFITAPENYRRIVNEEPIFLPNVVGVETLPLLRPFEKILSRRTSMTKWWFTFDLNYNDTVNRMGALYLNNGIDLDGFLHWQDATLNDACQRFQRREASEVSEAELERSWNTLAPQRAGMPGLPPP